MNFTFGQMKKRLIFQKGAKSFALPSQILPLAMKLVATNLIVLWAEPVSVCMAASKHALERANIILELHLKVCPHLYANANETCGTKANQNECQKVVCLVFA